MAYDPVLDREVALKVPKFSADQTHKIKHFLAEAATRFRHPNLVAVDESGQVGNDLYIASEFVSGVPLPAHLAKEPPNFRQAAQWVRDLALTKCFPRLEVGLVPITIRPTP